MIVPKKLIALGVVFSLVLAGCATPQDARERGALATYASAKSARTVSDCIASSWENMGHAGETSVRPLANGYSVQLVRLGNVHLLVEITDLNGGSTTKSYKGNAIGAGKLLMAVQSCQ
jgi:hypothetical protein